MKGTYANSRFVSLLDASLLMTPSFSIHQWLAEKLVPTIIHNMCDIILYAII